MNTNRCIVCEKPITWRFGICKECEKVYGSKAKNWPQWLRFLWADQQRLRRRERAQDVLEVSIDEILEVRHFTHPRGRKLPRHDANI